MALQEILKNPENEEAKSLLKLQVFIWLIFFSFGYIYFNKKSPVLAAVWTITDFLLAAASLKIALRTDKKLASYYTPLLGWTGFAGTLAVYQAAKNPDPIVKNIREMIY
jgi:tryptophan-rich sensory protein